MNDNDDDDDDDDVVQGGGKEVGTNDGSSAQTCRLTALHYIAL